MLFPTYQAREIVAQALSEDLGRGDITTLSLIPAKVQAEAWFVARTAGVIAGLPLVSLVYQQLDPTVQVCPEVADGQVVAAGAVLTRVVGPAQAILSGERVALNLLQRLSGIASLTHQYVEAVRGTRARILDTRKTTPGLRVLEKYAVAVAGGVNHRFGLDDAVLIKDNHIALLAAQGLSIAEVVRRAQANVGPMVQIEIEADTLEQAEAAVEAGATMVLLDNMPPDMLAEAVRRFGGRARLEASGGVQLATVRQIAASGVDFISVGALTHSVSALDIGLDWH